MTDKQAVSAKTQTTNLASGDAAAHQERNGFVHKKSSNDNSACDKFSLSQRASGLIKPSAGSASSPKPDVPRPAKQTGAPDDYIKKTDSKYSGTVLGFDDARNQPFVEIYFGSSSVGDVSWVKGEEYPVITFEPRQGHTSHRFSVDQIMKAIKEASEKLGPRDIPEGESELSEDETP